MLKNKLYQYGDESGRVPAHLHFGKEAYNSMLNNKDIVALINSETDERMTYLEMAQSTADIAISLALIGVRKGDVVSVCSAKRFEVLPSILGIICAGATFSPTDLTYGSFPLLHRLKISRPKVMFCSEAAFQTHRSTFEEAQSIEHYIIYDETPNEIIKDFQPLKSGRKVAATAFKDFIETAVLEDFTPVPVDGWTDNMFILYSSGTTGLPKGIPYTHLCFLLNWQSFVLDSYKGRCILNTREWYNNYGLTYTISCLMIGATVVYSPTGKQEDIMEAVQKYKTEVIQMTPSTIMELVKSSELDNYDVSSIRQILSASTPINGDTIDIIKKRLPNIEIVQLYGMSEAGSVCTELGAAKGSKPGSTGVPCRGFIIKVVDLETRQLLGPNQRGEICIKGPSVLKGYLNNECPDSKDEEGFLKTGDIGYYDDDGYFFIINRIKELIKFNDIGIAPAELEALLHQHPAVREAGVVGAEHPTHGEVPVAFVALQPGATATGDELVSYVNSRVTYTMRLAGGVRFVDHLPKVSGAKLNRKALKSMLEN